MTSLADIHQDDITAENHLKEILEAGFPRLRKLPDTLERDFGRYYQDRALGLMRRALPGLFALHLLILVPIVMFRHDASLWLWVGVEVIPMASVLALFWAALRSRDLAPFANVLAQVSLFICLAVTLYCAMHLDGHYFGQLAKYITIYVLVAAFAVLQLPVRQATTVALGALLVALAAAAAGEFYPFWLEVFMYFGGPLLICAAAGYGLELAERRNFVQRRLLEQESQRLGHLHAVAEAHVRQQRLDADYLALISGNLSLKELLTRSLRFLVEHTGAQVAVAYHLNARGRLRRLATWAVDAATLDDKKELEPEATLLGPALKSGEVMLLEEVPAGYLPLELGMGRLPCAALLLVPIVQAGRALAVLELGKVTPFSAEERQRAEAIRIHLAYAVTAANAREIAVRTAAA